MSISWIELIETQPLPKKRKRAQVAGIILRKNGSGPAQVMLNPALTDALRLSDSQKVRVFVSGDGELLGLAPSSASPHTTCKPTSQRVTYFQGLADALRAAGYELVSPPARSELLKTEEDVCVFRLADVAVKVDTRTAEQMMADAIQQGGEAIKRAASQVWAAATKAADVPRMPDAVQQGLTEAEVPQEGPEDAHPPRPFISEDRKEGGSDLAHAPEVEVPQARPYFDFKPCVRKVGEPFEDWLTRMFLHVPALPEEWKMAPNVFVQLLGEVFSGNGPEKAARNLGSRTR